MSECAIIIKHLREGLNLHLWIFPMLFVELHRFNAISLCTKCWSCRLPGHMLHDSATWRYYPCNIPIIYFVLSILLMCYVFYLDQFDCNIGLSCSVLCSLLSISTSIDCNDLWLEWSMNILFQCTVLMTDSLQL